jgi:hypothetical protein
MNDQALLDNTSDGSALNPLIARLKTVIASQSELDFTEMYNMVSQLQENNADVKFGAAKRLLKSYLDQNQQRIKTRVGMGRRRRNAQKKNNRKTHKRRR